jgi:diadenosine tetraphosphatase ApaH/serine/threonine PP2A family protein phosphatase
VILVGDLVAKGPDSRGVVRWARETGAESVLGNHDDHVVRALDGDRAVKKHHQEVARSLAPADAEWLRSRPLWIRVDEQGAGAGENAPHVVVHGGLVPGVALEAQSRDHLLNLRSIDAEGHPSKRLDGTPWAALWPGPERVVFGHDAIRGLQRHPFALGLDTGCVYGRALTALVLPENDLVSVPARRAYAEI